MIVSIIICVLVFISFFFVCGLMAFHTYLITNGRSRDTSFSDISFLVLNLNPKKFDKYGMSYTVYVLKSPQLEAILYEFTVDYSLRLTIYLYPWEGRLMNNFHLVICINPHLIEVIKLIG